MIYQYKYQVPKELTSVHVTQEIVKHEVIGRLAENLSRNIDLQHRADYDNLIYWAELVYIPTDDYKCIMKDLAALISINRSEAQCQLLESIRNKIRQT